MEKLLKIIEPKILFILKIAAFAITGLGLLYFLAGMAAGQMNGMMMQAQGGVLALFGFLGLCILYANANKK